MNAQAHTIMKQEINNETKTLYVFCLRPNALAQIIMKWVIYKQKQILIVMSCQKNEEYIMSFNY